MKKKLIHLMLPLEISFIPTLGLLDYKADTLSTQFYSATSIEGISYKEQIYNWGKTVSTSSAGEVLFS